MTTIKATCPSCGEVCLTPDDIELRVDPDELLGDYYAFLCPDCLQVVRKPADERIVRLLASGGVPVLEHDERRQRQRFEGPPVTHDDLLDFHALLSGDGWFDELEGLVRG